MRLVHLAPLSIERSIRRAGLTARKVALLVSPDGASVNTGAVYAMPVVPDFWTTYQWLRELRRWHDERMVAVYFRVQDDEPVYVGRYGQQQRIMKAAAAAAWVNSILPERSSSSLTALDQNRSLQSGE